MSKERKLRREQREQQQQRVRHQQALSAARRDWWRGVWQSVTRPFAALNFAASRGRVGQAVNRRSRSQRAFIAVVAIVGLVIIWQTVPDLALRIALTLLLPVALPVLAVVVFDRRSSQ